MGKRTWEESWKYAMLLLNLINLFFYLLFFKLFIISILFKFICATIIMNLFICELLKRVNKEKEAY